MFSSTVPGRIAGRWGTHEICPHRLSFEMRSIGVRPILALPEVGWTSPRTTAAAVDFPAPDLPRKTVTLPGSMLAVRSNGATVARPGEATLSRSKTTGETARSGQGRFEAAFPGASAFREASVSPSFSSMSKALSAATTPSAEAWNCAPTSRSGLKHSGVSMMIARPEKRSRSPPTMRRPTSTATSAVDTVARNSRTAPERKAT